VDTGRYQKRCAHPCGVEIARASPIGQSCHCRVATTPTTTPTPTTAPEHCCKGLNEDADRFAYRAQLLQRQVLRRQGHLGRALGSWLLDDISGYGYKPVRSAITYLIVILSFAVAYFALTNFALTPFLPSHSSPLAWYEAIVLSISSFHGRGLFPSGLSLGDPIAILAACEAIIGLLIEITFIATFTQRFFAR